MSSVDAMRAARDYLDMIPEAEAGGDDEAVRIVRMLDAAIKAAEAEQPNGSVLRCKKCGGETTIAFKYGQPSPEPVVLFPDPPKQRGFWVIERMTSGRSSGYWAGSRGGNPCFRLGIDNAVQFCRERDAYWATKDWIDENMLLTEHVCVGDPETPSHEPAVTESERIALAQANATLAEVATDTDRLRERLRALPEPAREPQVCPTCGGNNGDAPCAYPRTDERQPGCLLREATQEIAVGVDHTKDGTAVTVRRGNEIVYAEFHPREATVPEGCVVVRKEEIEQIENGLVNQVVNAESRNDKYDVGYLGAMKKMVSGWLAAPESAK